MVNSKTELKITRCRSDRAPPTIIRRFLELQRNPHCLTRALVKNCFVAFYCLFIFFFFKTDFFCAWGAQIHSVITRVCKRPTIRLTFSKSTVATYVSLDVNIYWQVESGNPFLALNDDLITYDAIWDRSSILIECSEICDTPTDPIWGLIFRFTQNASSASLAFSVNDSVFYVKSFFN